MKQVNCDLCGSSQAGLLVSQGDIVHRRAPPDQKFCLCKCDRCGLIYQNPRLEPQEISVYYPEDYEFYSDKSPVICKAKSLIRNLLSSPHLNRLLALPFYLPRMRNVFINLLQRPKKDFVRLMRPCRFLDIGCGSGLSAHIWGYGSSLHSLKRSGFDAVGIEPSSRARNIAKNYGLEVFSSVDELKGEKFDCVRMNWSLEHVDSPSMYFSACDSLLKPGGKLVIGVPNYSGIIYKMFPHCVEIPVHNYYFTPETLEAYFSRFNFKVLDKYTFSYPAMFVFAQKCLDPKAGFSLSPWQAIYFQSVLNKFDSRMLGNDMMYLCEKNRN